MGGGGKGRPRLTGPRRASPVAGQRRRPGGGRRALRGGCAVRRGEDEEDEEEEGCAATTGAGPAAGRRCRGPWRPAPLLRPRRPPPLASRRRVAARAAPRPAPQAPPPPPGGFGARRGACPLREGPRWRGSFRSVAGSPGRPRGAVPSTEMAEGRLDRQPPCSLIGGGRGAVISSPPALPALSSLLRGRDAPRSRRQGRCDSSRSPREAVSSRAPGGISDPTGAAGGELPPRPRPPRHGGTVVSALAPCVGGPSGCWCPRAVPLALPSWLRRLKVSTPHWGKPSLVQKAHLPPGAPQERRLELAGLSAS